MVVEVMDLDIPALRFSRTYDSARYRRGSKIYYNDDVRITNVEKIDDKEYFAEGRVNGNYDIYTTTLKVVGNIITETTCTCEDYIKGNLCKHIIATSFELMNPTHPSTEKRRNEIEEQKRLAIKRRLEEIKREKEESERKYKYQRKYRSGLNIIEGYKEFVDARNIDNYDLNELYNTVQENKKEQNTELASSIKLDYTIEIEDLTSLKVSFKIGQKRMYVLNHISQFYEAYIKGIELYYGKQLKFVPKRENFTEDSKPIFDYIIKYAEMINYNSKYNNYGMESSFDKYIYISRENLDDFLNINKNREIVMHTRDYDIGYNFTNEPLDIYCTFKKEKVTLEVSTSWYYGGEEYEESEEYVLRLNISNYYILISYTKIYVFYKNKIYTMNIDNNIIKQFKLFEQYEEIVIPEDKLEEFKKYVLPQIKTIQTENLPAEIAKEGLIVNKLASKILLDIDDEENLMLELKFCYLDYEFNILDSNYKTYIKQHNIVRDVPAEADVIERIFTDGFEPVIARKQFAMKNPDDIYEFLLTKIEGYMNDFEVLATDKFKNKQIRQPKISNIGIRIDNGLLELDISKMNIDIDEIKNVLKDYSIKKKYYKLKNGDFLNLANNEDLNLLDEMSATLDIDYSKIENGKVNLPISRSFYLEKLIDTNKEIKVAKNEQFTKLVDSIENSEISDKLKIDEEFETKLRDYQKIGYKWLKTLDTYKFGGILADDMGLGKTLQVIALLKTELNSKNKTTSIVVCPSTLVLNWKAEVEKWCDTIKVLIIKGNATERAEQIKNYQNYDLVITSYDLLKRDVENYEDKTFRYIIADEAQYIKNSTTQNATSLKSLKGETKFALTGTPIENSVAELWSIFDFIMPGYLYNYNKFKKKFEEPIIKLEDKEALVRLKKLISPFILRRVKKDVLTELPEKNITVMKNEMEKEQEKLYLSYLAQTQEEVAKELSNSGFEKSKFKILMLLTRLRQICCHPSLFIENYKGESGKLKQCLSLVEEAISSGHKILIFSSYTSMFDIIEQEFDKRDIKYFKLVGNTPVSKRVEMVDEFNNNDSVKVFLISLKAGGTGLNLTSADVVIHYDPWWNISSENQATDRAYRIGQKNSVQVYKLITSNSIEEKINKMQERKEKMSEDILSTEQTFINKLSKEEVMDLFK